MTGMLMGRRVILTGAGSGIGRAIAVRLVCEGARVLGVDRSAEGLAGTARLVGEAPLGRFAAMTVDLADRDAPERVLARSPEAIGPADTLVNNAGVGDAKPLHLTPDEDLDRYLAINLRALFRLSRAFIQALGDAAGASVVNIASVFGMVGFAGSAPYAATKAAVIGLTREMAAQYGPRGVRVNAVAPGTIVTPLTAARMTQRWFRAATVEATPLRRAGTPEEVAGAVAFLCSADASFITGQVLAVDGGWSTSKLRPAPEG